MSPLSTASKDEDQTPSECTIEQITDALRWAKKQGSLDHIRGDGPEPAQRWIRERSCRFSNASSPGPLR